MNASATIRANYIRASIINAQPLQPGYTSSVPRLEARPAQDPKLTNFKAVDHIAHRQQCEKERMHAGPYYDAGLALASVSYVEFDDDNGIPATTRFKRIFAVFLFRDPTYLVAIIFALGSLVLVINAFFDLLPRIFPSTQFEAEEAVAIPITVLIGSILFFIAGVFDTFGALNADRGNLETTKGLEGNMELKYKPALLGSNEWRWIPSYEEFNNLLFGNLAFQAGLLVLFGGVIFMFGGITEFPDIIPEESPLFGALVFGPQVVHGAMFFIANALLALSEQEVWWKPKVQDMDWQGAVLNTVGGFGFMMAGIFLFQKEELASALAAMGGSVAFLLGSVVRWFVVMEFC